MTAPTVPVTCAASDQNGPAVAGAKYTAKLNSTEIYYNGFIVPEIVRGTADANGICILNLWPNALGVAGSLYEITATDPDTGKAFLKKVLVSVPNNACNLHEILVQAPYPTLDAAAQTLIALQATAAALVQTLRDSIIATLGSIGYLPPVAYATALSMTLPAQTVSYGGQAYAPALSALPFTTSGVFEAAKFRLIQGLTGVDLASAEGVGLVGNGYGLSPGGISLPVNPLTVFVRSSPIPLKTAITSAMVTDASVNYSAQFQAVINYLRDYGGGKIILPPKTRIWAANLSVFTGIEIDAYDWTTVIEVPGNQLGIYVNPGIGGTTNIADNQRNIALRKFKIKGNVVSHGFAEHNHLIGLSAISHSELIGMCVEGFQGDGINFGSGWVGNTERHNFHNRVIGGRIDGVNNNNRNGISVIDSDGLEIHGMEFVNCTRPNMPGAIDMEPDGWAYPIMRNIKITSNSFDSCGGNVGVIGVIHPALVTADLSNLTIENNTAKNLLHTAAFITINTYRAPTAASADNNITIRKNQASNGPTALCLFSGKRITVEDNTFSDFSSGMLLGYSDSPASVVRDVDVTNNKFLRLASGGGAGLNIFNAHHLALTRNKLIDCGSGLPANSNGIDFQAGASSYVTLDGNEILSPTGKTLVAIQKEATHTLQPATNRYVGNRVEVPGVFFRAEDSDTLEQDYLPVVAGGGFAGVGTYSMQYGVYKSMGKTAFCRLKVEVAAGHTGTGVLQVSIPLPAAAAAANQERAVSVLLTGVASVGGQVGLLNPAAIGNGVLGALRFYATGTGSMAPINVPAGAFTIYASFSYQTA